MSAAAPLLESPPNGIVEALRRIVAGSDATAWTWLVEHEGPAMFRVAQRALGSAAAADDACQEAFLHLRRGAHRFRAPMEGDPEAAARAWLLRVAANAAAMHARTERRRAGRERRLHPAVEQHPAADDQIDALRRAIAELPDNQRQPLVLHHLGGQDYVAIGAALGISPGAARVQAHRGLKNLRCRMTQAGVLAAATGLLGRLSATEAAMPIAATARWNAIITSTSTPAATTAAIFGGISTMTKITILGATLSAAVLCTFSLVPVQAEEHREEKPKVEVPAANEPKKEAHDAMAEGTKGVSEGVIVSLEKGKLVLKTSDGNLLFMPHWRGGNPKDGGGLDKAVLEKVGSFKPGQRVRIAWTWSERRRIEEISASK
jgi:RNA polymerase sigma-70 factor (ECF subfamily)